VKKAVRAKQGLAVGDTAVVVIQVEL